MKRLDSIVAGTDFSTCSRSALFQAARLAGRRQAALHVVHVIDSLVLSDLAEALRQSPDELRRQVLGDTEGRLERLLKDIERPESFATDVRVGPPVQEILEKTRSVSADLLVLGAQGEVDAERGIGTLAARCVRSSPCETLLVQERQTGPFRHILACIDFSPVSRAVVEEAIALATLDGSRVEVAHVFYGPWHRLHYRAPTPQAPPKFQQQYTDVLRARLEGFIEPFRKAAEGIEVESCLLESQSCGRRLAEHARERQADLLVLGTSGKSNLRHLLLGGTAERILREASCSMLVVPAGAA